jgi:hypothetical protein
MSGNMRSRFTDFLTSDGEKPDRNRDQEFMVGAGVTRSEIMEGWEKGWRLVYDTLKSLTPHDLTREVTIRSEPHSVLQAVTRQLAHCSQHIGQIIYLAKYLRGPEWKTLSIAKGQSAAVNAAMAEKFKLR